MADNSTREFSNSYISARRAQAAIDRYESSRAGQKAFAVDTVSHELTDMVRSMLTANYGRSGVKTQSGKLLAALQGVEVRFIMSSKSPRISIKMPPGISDYNKQDGGGNFYRAAASVNYGATRGTKNTNKTERRKIKRQAQKKAKKEGVEGSVAGFMGSTVTQPKGFWELTGGQQSQILAFAIRRFFDIVLKA